MEVAGPFAGRDLRGAFKDRNPAGPLAALAHDEARAQGTYAAMAGFDEQGRRTILQALGRGHLDVAAAQAHQALLRAEIQVDRAVGIHLQLGAVRQAQAAPLGRARAQVRPQAGQPVARGCRTSPCHGTGTRAREQQHGQAAHRQAPPAPACRARGLGQGHAGRRTG